MTLVTSTAKSRRCSSCSALNPNALRCRFRPLLRLEGQRPLWRTGKPARRGRLDGCLRPRVTKERAIPSRRNVNRDMVDFLTGGSDWVS